MDSPRAGRTSRPPVRWTDGSRCPRSSRQMLSSRGSSTHRMARGAHGRSLMKPLAFHRNNCRSGAREPARATAQAHADRASSHEHPRRGAPCGLRRVASRRTGNGPYRAPPCHDPKHPAAASLGRRCKIQRSPADRALRIGARLLSDPRLSVTEIAFRLGYRDASAFFKIFKRWTGQTPAEYRRALTAAE